MFITDFFLYLKQPLNQILSGQKKWSCVIPQSLVSHTWNLANAPFMFIE